MPGFPDNKKSSQNDRCSKKAYPKIAINRAKERITGTAQTRETTCYDHNDPIGKKNCCYNEHPF
jgi:hypothetical protein